MKFLPILFVTILLTLLIIWSIIDGSQSHEKGIHLGTQYLVHQYIQKSYLHIMKHLLANNHDSTPIKEQKNILTQFDRDFTPLSMGITRHLERFVRANDVITDLYRHEKSKEIDMFLFPDTFLEKCQNNYYRQLLVGASLACYSKNIFGNFTNKDAKNYLQQELISPIHHLPHH